MASGRASDRLHRARVLVQLSRFVAAPRCRLRDGVAGGTRHRYSSPSAKPRRSDARRLHIHRGAVAVRNGRDPARFRPDPAARQRIRAALGVADEQVVVLAVSRLVWHKGHPELSAAMRLVPDAVLWVAGERLTSDRGPDMAALLRDAAWVHGFGCWATARTWRT